jgi:hypothetical protein
MSYRLGIDVGGTFTDLLLCNEKSGALTLTKVAATPPDHAIGVIHISGPAVSTQKDRTMLLLPKHDGRLDAYQNILIFPDSYENKASKAKVQGKAPAEKNAKFVAMPAPPAAKREK